VTALFSFLSVLRNFVTKGQNQEELYLAYCSLCRCL